MKNRDCLQWLKKEGVLDIAQRHYKSMARVFKDCLAAKEKEKLLIIGDTGLKGNNLSAALSACYYLYAKEKGFDVSIVMQESKTRGDSAEEDVVNALFDHPPYNIVVTNLSDKLGDLRNIKSYRRFCKEKPFKFVSTTSLGYIPTEYITQLMTMLSIDYKTLRRRQNQLKVYLDNAKEITVKTDKGTNIKFDVAGYDSISADGDFKEYGQGGNLPAGEVYIAPNEGKVSGKFVIDASSRNRFKTEITREPIIVKVKKGAITKIEGGVEADLLKQSLKWAAERAKYPARVKKICELGIGMNKNAKVIGATIIDEKAHGTAHIAIGSNYWFGGSIKTIIHLDQVFRDPQVFVDGVPLKIP
ncbi:aminopeptidase [Candidatus Woesearchaeota archaeon]|nr:aminopeptidase [Candidatus Woesearchaeota archaeon]